MNTINDRIAACRHKNGMSQEELARRIGITRVSVSKWESGLNQPKGRYLNELASALGVSVSWLLSGKDSVVDETKNPTDNAEPFSNVELATLGVYKIPVLSYVQAGNWQESQDFRGIDGGYEYVTADLDDDSRAFAVWVQGNSMTPEFNEGDLIIVDPDVAPLPGDFVVAKNGGEECTFKKYRPRGHKEDGSEIFELVPLNEDYPTLRSETCPIRIIGTMIEHRKFRRRKR